MVACCPFHDEKTPSFTVTPDRNTYRCFGCGVKGDAIDWMRNRHHLSFPDAVIHLANLVGLALPGDRDETADTSQRKHLAALYLALKEAARIHTFGLSKSARAQYYLTHTRKLTAETIAKFGIGFVANGIIEVLAKNIKLEVLIDSGLAGKNNDGVVYDRFRHRIMFSIHNESGELIGFGGRSMREKPNKTPKYINCPETEIFHKGRELYGLHLAKIAIRRTGLAVIVEGYLDVASLHQAGELRAVAPLGTVLSNQQARRLLVHADTVIVAFDGDKAGRKAALASAAVLLDEMHDGKAGKFLFLPEGEDPDSFIRANGIIAWIQAIEAATPLSRFLSDFVIHGLDRDMPESQVKAAEKANAILARIQHAELFKRAMQIKFEEIIGIPLSPICIPIETLV